MWYHYHVCRNIFHPFNDWSVRQHSWLLVMVDAVLCQLGPSTLPPKLASSVEEVRKPTGSGYRSVSALTANLRFTTHSPVLTRNITTGLLSVLFWKYYNAHTVLWAVGCTSDSRKWKNPAKYPGMIRVEFPNARYGINFWEDGAMQTIWHLKELANIVSVICILLMGNLRQIPTSDAVCIQQLQATVHTASGKPAQPGSSRAVNNSETQHHTSTSSITGWTVHGLYSVGGYKLSTQHQADQSGLSQRTLGEGSGNWPQ